MLVSEPRDKMQERQETGGKNGVWSMLKLPAEVRPKVQESPSGPCSPQLPTYRSLLPTASWKTIRLFNSCSLSTYYMPGSI